MELVRHQLPLFDGLSARSDIEPQPLLKLTPTKSRPRKPSAKSDDQVEPGEFEENAYSASISFLDPTLDDELTLSIVAEPKYTAQIIVANNEVFLEFVHKSLMAIGSRFLKIMCKSFITTIDPNRRRTYPYSKSKSSQPRLPPWWPPDVRFREPDHLIQPECERLIEFMLTWCLDNPQRHMKRGIKTLWSDMWRFNKFEPKSDAKSPEERNQKLYMLQQIERIACQREAFLKDEIDDTEVCHALFFDVPPGYRFKDRKRKRSLSPSKVAKVNCEGPSTAELRDNPSPKKLSRPRRERLLESPKPETKVSLGSSIFEQCRAGNVTGEQHGEQHGERPEGPLCEKCRACDCRRLLTLTIRPAMKVIDDEPIIGEPRRHNGTDWPVVPGVANKSQGDDESAAHYVGGRRHLSSRNDADSLLGSVGFLRGRPIPDRLQPTTFAFPGLTAALSSPDNELLASPSHVNGPGSFGGRLDQVVPATPSEKGFITDTVDEPAADGYIDAVHQAFKEDRRSSACKTLPRVDSPNPVVPRRFSLPEPSLAAFEFQRRAGHRTDSADDWQQRSGNNAEIDDDSEYQPQESD